MDLYNVTACEGAVLIIGDEPERKFRLDVIWADTRKAKQPPTDRPVRTAAVGTYRNARWGCKWAAPPENLSIWRVVRS